MQAKHKKTLKPSNLPHKEIRKGNKAQSQEKDVNNKGKRGIHRIEIKKPIDNISKTKSWFFVKINKINNPLAKLTKKKRETTQINKIKSQEK